MPYAVQEQRQSHWQHVCGRIITVAEIPGGALFLSSFDTSKYFPIVKALNIDFLKPAKSDVTVEISMTTEQIAGIQAEADSNGKAEFVLKGELKDSHRHFGELFRRLLSIFH